MKNKAAILLAAITLAAFVACADPMRGELDLFCPEDHFLFRTIDNGTAVEITWYVGGGIDVRIPPYIRGLPVTIIGPHAFTDLGWGEGHEEWVFRDITNVAIPSSVTHIGDLAFAGNQLTSIYIPNSVIRIGDGAFGNNHLTIISIPNSVTDIGIWAFAENQLVSVTIGSNVAIAESEFVTGLFDDRFGDSFAPFYESQGRMAGTYTYSNGTWAFQPR